MDDRSDELSRAWAAQQPGTDDHVAVWLAFAGSYVSGAGPTVDAAWASAKDAEVLAVLGDDSAQPPDRPPSTQGRCEAVTSRAPTHRVIEVRVSRADLAAFADAFAITEERVLRLIEAVVRAEPIRRD